MANKAQDIFHDLYMRLLQGQWMPGDKLPAEFELCRYYSVSRVTVRSALKLLLDQGTIVRIHGKGTFVKADEQPCQHLERKLLLREKVPATGGLLAQLQITDAAALPLVWHFSHVLLIDGHPVALEDSYIMESYGDTLSCCDPLQFEEMRSRLYGRGHHSQRLSVGAVSAVGQLCSLLQVPSGHACLRSRRCEVLSDGTVAEVVFRISTEACQV